MNLRSLSIHRIVLVRLIPAWLILSAVMGAAGYWLESRRVDREVFGLATEAARQFTPAAEKTLLEGNPTEHLQALRALLHDDQFAGIRLYDKNRKPLFAVWARPDPQLEAVMRGEPSRFPGPGNHRDSVVRMDGHMAVRSLVCLTDPDQRVFGYFEGIYLVPAQTVEGISSRVRWALTLVLIVTTLTTLTLYPVIIALNSRSMRLSDTLLDSIAELMRVLGSAIAKRDSDTDSHNYRVTLYSTRLAELLGRPDHEIAALMAGAFLHDVGKIGIPDGILLKADRLTPDEYETMKTHVTIGEEILQESSWLGRAREVVASHHEHFDGTGYPHGLKGEEIPFNARLFTIVDVFDALTSERPYKPPMPLEQALRTMREDSGLKFDPDILASFERVAPTYFNHYGQADITRLKAFLVSAIHRYHPA
jgi:HD-GYP domain-containing protein (c-di-GMP phosphodiesterase class II)